MILKHRLEFEQWFNGQTVTYEHAGAWQGWQAAERFLLEQIGDMPYKFTAAEVLQRLTGTVGK